MSRAEYMTLYRAKNKAKLAEQTLEWRRNNPDRVSAHAKASYERNRDSRIERVRRYSETANGRAVSAAARAKWNSENPEQVALQKARSCVARSSGVPRQLIPDALVELKAAELMVRREIKRAAQGTSASGRDPQGHEAEGPQARSPQGDAPESPTP